MAAIAAVAGPLVSGVTGMMQSSYQAKVAKMNAQVAQENADLASTKSEIDAQESDNQYASLLGEQENAQAASGVTLSGKSQILTRNAARHAAQSDSMKLIQAGQVERYGHLVEKANFKAEAAAAKTSGMMSLIGGVIGAAGAIPGSLSSSASATATPYKYIPQPIAKPASLPTSFTNPLLARRPAWALNRGMT